MPLPTAILGEAIRWLLFTVVSLVPGLVATALWTPFLAAARVRALFSTLPPSGRILPTYLLVGIAASIPYVAGFLAILAVVDSSGAAWSNAFLTLSLFVSSLYVVVLPAIAVIGLPRAGIDWDPTDSCWSTWLVLAAGAAWYAVLFTVPLLALAFVFGLPGGY